MTAEKTSTLKLKFQPATKDRWNDLARLFGERGACAGCWCMYWHLPRKDFDAQRGEKNKKAFKRMIDSGEVLGIIAYDKDEPIGWCSVAPREKFAGLARSRSLKLLDDQPVWSVVCLFIDKHYRRQGVAVATLKATIKHARKYGGKIVEGYPSITKGKLPDPWIWTGTLSAYLQAGFKEVKRPSKSRAIVRAEA